MKTKPFHSVILSLVVMCVSALAADRPNVILIITDDQGYGDVGAHGNPVLKTPHLDKFREQSVSFSDFHVAPMCSPTRGQLMTGLDAMRSGCTAVSGGRSMMRADLPTMADFFADSGYATGHFGKWHLGDSYPHRPQDRGFQETLHHRAWGITSLADPWENQTDPYFDPVLSHNGVDKLYEGYCTDIFFGESMRWIDGQVSAEQPFFVYLATNTPHVPDIVADEYSDPYRGRHDGLPIPTKFYGMIANLDENLGELEAFLADRGLKENTILIYMTDNGTQSTDAMKIFNAGMRAKKTSIYEGGHRVPLMVRWPKGKLAHGNSVDELTQVQDLLPTLIDLCGLKNETEIAFDGLSLAGLLKGTVRDLPDRKLVVQYRPSGAPWDPAVVMWDKWRLLMPRQGRRPPDPNAELELYHLGLDPWQQKDVAADHPEVFQAMKQHYEEWYAEAKKLFDLPRWITIGHEISNPMMLYSQDWVGDPADNPRALSRATARGYWNVMVDRAGEYEIELRRWPERSGKRLTEGWPERSDLEDAARPIAKARLRVAGRSLVVDTRPEDTHARFRVRLPTGRAQLETTFYDAEGEALCSAFYVSVRRL